MQFEVWASLSLMSGLVLESQTLTSKAVDSLKGLISPNTYLRLTGSVGIDCTVVLTQCCPLLIKNQSSSEDKKTWHFSIWTSALQRLKKSKIKWKCLQRQSLYLDLYSLPISVVLLQLQSIMNTDETLPSYITSQQTKTALHTDHI